MPEFTWEDLIGRPGEQIPAESISHDITIRSREWRTPSYVCSCGFEGKGTRLGVLEHQTRVKLGEPDVVEGAWRPRERPRFRSVTADSVFREEVRRQRQILDRLSDGLRVTRSSDPAFNGFDVEDDEDPSTPEFSIADGEDEWQPLRVTDLRDTFPPVTVRRGGIQYGSGYPNEPREVPEQETVTDRRELMDLAYNADCNCSFCRQYRGETANPLDPDAVQDARRRSTNYIYNPTTTTNVTWGNYTFTNARFSIAPLAGGQSDEEEIADEGPDDYEF